METDPDNAAAIACGAGELARLGDAERAREWAERAMLLDPDNIDMLYNLGCAMVLLGDHEAALDFLKDVFRVGEIGTIAWAEQDSDLDPLRGDPGYKRLLAEAHARLASSSPGAKG
jgi:adenylate cyclase